MRLNGAEVGTNNHGTWELVGKIHGPDASAGANIENATRSSRNGCAEELAIQRQSKDMVTKIQAVLFELIVGQDISTFAVGVCGSSLARIWIAAVILISSSWRGSILIRHVSLSSW
jgi:hypothetical protein